MQSDNRIRFSKDNFKIIVSMNMHEGDMLQPWWSASHTLQWLRCDHSQTIVVPTIYMYVHSLTQAFDDGIDIFDTKVGFI